MDRSSQGKDINVLDGVALVMGSAIASLHMLRVFRSGLSTAGWLLFLLTYSCVALTATGPFMFLARRYSRRLPGYPKIGDWLWALLGVPWVVTAFIESVVPGEDPRHNPLFSMTLTIGLGISCLIAVIIVWSAWVIVPPERAARIEGVPWTNRVGLILAIAWPIQCGLGMVVLG
jgi:hypothetical protein